MTKNAPPSEPIKLEEQIREVRRELGIRRRVYPAWVRKGRMADWQSALYLRRMDAVLQSLKELQAQRTNEPQTQELA